MVMMRATSEVMFPSRLITSGSGFYSTALELDNTLGEAHTPLAFSLDLFDWDWASAEREFRQAIELNPGYATAHHWYAWHLIEMGRNSEAIAEMRKAENRDPLSLIISADVAEILLVAHSYDEAIEESRKTIDMDPIYLCINNAIIGVQERNTYGWKKPTRSALTRRSSGLHPEHVGAGSLPSCSRCTRQLASLGGISLSFLLCSP
jgi:Tetratricopeptide repeat